MARPLDEIELDALREMLNIGVGYAADSFSRMIDSPVRLAVPEIRLVFGEEAAGEIGALSGEGGSMVIQSFRGGFSADAVFLFPGGRSIELVRQMIGHEVAASEIMELEQDALIEVGNILFNSCVSVISDTIGIPFSSGMPQFMSGALDQVLQDIHADDACLLLMKIAFVVEHVNVEGYILFLMKVESIDSFIDAIKKYMGLAA